MNTEKMTIHKALAELKVLDDRIDKKILDTAFIYLNKHNNKKPNGKTVNELADDIKSDYKSIRTLLNRRRAIKQAVTQSNGTTTIEVNGETFTIAEAIEMRNKGMKLYRELLSCMENQYASAIKTLEAENGDKLTKMADAYIASMFSKDNTDTSDAENIRQKYIENNKFDLIDPIGLKSEIEKLDAYYSNFYAEIDAAISVSNATTTIEISYEVE